MSPKATVTPTGYLLVGGTLFAPSEALGLAEFVREWFTESEVERRQ